MIVPYGLATASRVSSDHRGENTNATDLCHPRRGWLAALSVFCGPVWAQANRTFVSGHGSDTGNCGLGAPCRRFAYAITQTNAGGEITVLDPAGYGSVTINKSVNIVDDGVGEAGVKVTSATDAIDINVSASDVVNLRGLTLVGGGFGTNGIKFNNLGALNIQNCVIRGFTNSGINLLPAGTVAFNISDTIVSNIVGIGIAILPSSAVTVTAALNRVQVNGAGLQVLTSAARPRPARSMPPSPTAW
jgi:hypothetical protein